jgi:acyl dehydratase
VTLPGLDDLAGEVFGPVVVEPTPYLVAEFAAATGDDPARLGGRVPPMFANRLLFAVAPALLGDPRVGPYTRSLIHSEQRYRWQGHAAIGEPLTVTGRVGSVRARGALHLVGFEVTADGDGGRWLTGTSSFLLSAEAAASAEEAAEPPVADRPEVDGPLDRLELPAPGEPLTPVVVGASRLDLLRYAAVTRDWNPIHWDHHTAVAAGLPGTIVHGLLLAAWMARAAARHAGGAPPLASMAVRFRRPLRPATPARVEGVVAARDEAGADLDLGLVADGERLATARIRVTT